MAGNALQSRQTRSFPQEISGVENPGHKKFLIKDEFDRGADAVTVPTITMKNRLIVTLCGALSAIAFSHAATLDVDKGRSRIQVDAKATGHTFAGTLEKFNASVTGDAASLKPAGFDLTWNFSDLKTADEKRDAEMIKWLGGKAPKGSFKFTKSWADKSGKTMGMGTLTIHGVSKTVSFPYTASQEGGWVTIDGKVAMDYQDFGLPIIRAMAVMTVEPKLSVRFHIVGKVK